MQGQLKSQAGQRRRSARNAAPPSAGSPDARRAVMSAPVLSPAKKLAKMMRERPLEPLANTPPSVQHKLAGQAKVNADRKHNNKIRRSDKSDSAAGKESKSVRKIDKQSSSKHSSGGSEQGVSGVTKRATKSTASSSAETPVAGQGTKSANNAKRENASSKKRTKQDRGEAGRKRPKKDKSDKSASNHHSPVKEVRKADHEASTSGSPVKKHRSKKSGVKSSRAAPDAAAAAGGDIAALLRLGEGAAADTPMSDDSDWEAVDTRVSDLVTKGFVEVTLPSDVALQKRKKKGFDVEAYMRRQLQHARRELQQLVHKAHLLCLLSRALQLNALLNSETPLACAMSMLPSKYAYPPKRVAIAYVEQFLRWFREKVPLEAPAEGVTPSEDVFRTLETRLRTKKAHSPLELVCLFVLIMRAIGVDCRLVLSLQPAPLKPPATTTSAAASKTPKPAAGNPAKAATKHKPDKKDVKTPVAAKKSSSAAAAGKARRSAPTPPTRTGSDRKVRQRPGPSAAADDSSDDSSGDEFEPRRPDRRVLSSSSGSSEAPAGRSPRAAADCWAEVYVEEELRWVSVDVCGGGVHCVAQIRKRATQPLTYVVGCDNSGHMKDLTARYDPKWHSSTRRLRVEPDWWAEATGAWRPAATRRDKEEDEDLQRDLQERPMPQSIAEFKDHPLYALERHLLKFEAIYPPTAVPLGYIGKGERRAPVYARECVRTLHARETWIKQARVVKDGEKPYKIVKARPKWDKMLQKVITDKPLEVFGRWQTTEYVPPRAVGGKVPRNDYGNVELFKPSMLPGGTVHLNVEGLSRVAKKLGIDCAPAMVGWDYHCGGSHPVFEGYVVCEEFEDTLMDAWEADQREARKRQREKREKRVLDNWRRLVRGLLIRQRLARKYDFTDEKTGAKRPPTASGSGKPAVSKKTGAPHGHKPKPESKSEFPPNLEPQVKTVPTSAARGAAGPSAGGGAGPSGREGMSPAAKASALLRAEKAKMAVKQESKERGPKEAGSEDEEAPESQEEVARRVEASMASMGLRRVALSSDSEADSDTERAGKTGTAASMTGAGVSAAVTTKPSPSMPGGSTQKPAPPAAAAAGRKRRSAPAGRRRVRRAASPVSRSPSPAPPASGGRPARRRSARAAPVTYRETAGSGSEAEGEPPVREDDLTSDEEQPFAKAAVGAASSGEDSDFMGF